MREISKKSLTQEFRFYSKIYYLLIKIIFNQCLDCHCIGVLQRKEKKVYLFPEEVLSSRSIHTQKHDLKSKTQRKKTRQLLKLTKHGFATNQQKTWYVGIGSLFWITVMLISIFKFLIVF